MDVIIDTDIASTFGKIGKFHLLRKLFVKSELYITIAVMNELLESKKSGYEFARVAIRNVKILKPKPREIKETAKILSKRTLGRGESESIAIAKARKMLFLTNDKIAEREAKACGIEMMNLSMIIRQFWKHQAISVKEAKDIIEEIESKDNIVFLNKTEIFE